VDGGGDSDPNVTGIDKRREFYVLKAMIPARSWPVVEHVVLNDLAIRDMMGCSHAEAFDAQLARLAAGLDAVK
jgi:hypothetical protein